MLALLTALPWVWRLVSIGAVLLALGGSFTWYTLHERNIGWQNAINAVAAKDQDAIRRVEQGHSDIAACRASGKTWDVTTGTCS